MLSLQITLKRIVDEKSNYKYRISLANYGGMPRM